MRKKYGWWAKPLLAVLGAGAIYYLSRDSLEDCLGKVKEAMGEKKEFCAAESYNMVKQGFGVCGGELEKNLLAGYEKNPAEFGWLKRVAEGMEAIEAKKFEEEASKVSAAPGMADPKYLFTKGYLTEQGSVGVLGYQGIDSVSLVKVEEVLGEKVLTCMPYSGGKLKEGAKRVVDGFSAMGQGLMEYIKKDDRER